MNILITGSRGFIGQHLVNSLKYKSSFDYNLIEVNKNDFKNLDSLDSKVKKSTIIVHLAAVNRHDDESFIYESNMLLSKILVDSIKRTVFKGKLIFSSSIQESLKNSYGDSKKRSRNLFIEESKENKFNFSGLILPNVFGPFGRPNYNSFIPTFCQRIINNSKINIKQNNEVPLIYIDKVIKKITDEIQDKNSNYEEKLIPDIVISVQEVKNKLIEYKKQYIDLNIIPNIDSDFDHNLFNTFRSYIDLNTFPIKHLQNIDKRGNFIEILRSNSKGQYSYSTTKPNITRGNHFHTKKIERFSVIKGDSLIQLRKIGTDEIIEFKLSGQNPSYIDMPVWYTHNISNIGDEELITLFWINEPYDINNPDTYTEKV